MTILVLNSGSSSIKYKLFDKESLEELYSGIKQEVISHVDAIDEILNHLKDDNIIPSIADIFCVAHRVVHGGVIFNKATLVDDEVMRQIDNLSSLAPLHNPANLAGIKAVCKTIGDLKQVVVFDTAFHQTMPQYATMYPIPYEYYEKFAIRKYGFHGTSHEYVSKKAADELNLDINNANFITLHLGNGASICAIQNGKSIDTTMGFTPLEGLMMGTRCGAMDATIVTYLQEKLNISCEAVNHIMIKESGFKGLTGTSDFREVIKMVEKGDKKAQLAIELFVYRIKKYIGSYMMILGRVDAIIFTGGIGENSKLVRDMVCQTTDKFNLKSLVIKTNEELSIAQQAKSLLS